MAKYNFYLMNLILHQFSFSFKRRMCTKVEDVSCGAIKVTSNNPFDLFDDWFKESSRFMVIPTNVSFILSTYSPKNKVTSRVMKLLSHADDKFVFVGNVNTEKIKDLKKNPDVSLCFWWSYYKDKYFVMRQIRVTGKAQDKGILKSAQYFTKIPLPIKVGYNISRQNEPVQDWFAHQVKFLKNMAEAKDTPGYRPENMTAFEITTKEIQFYHNIVKTNPFFIADRVLFQKDGSNWKHKHIAA